jgi:hypothetical protein
MAIEDLTDVLMDRLVVIDQQDARIYEQVRGVWARAVAVAAWPGSVGHIC